MAGDGQEMVEAAGAEVVQMPAPKPKKAAPKKKAAAKKAAPKKKAAAKKAAPKKKAAKKAAKKK